VSETTLAFGLSRDAKPLAAMPSGYLRWSLAAYRLNTRTRRAIQRELDRRATAHATRETAATPATGKT
jgi:hypothetical protein